MTRVTHQVGRVLLLPGLLPVFAGCARNSDVRAPLQTAGEVVWSYDVAAGPDGTLAVDAEFRGPVAGLAVESGAERFVDGLSVWNGSAFGPVGWNDARLPPLCRTRCRTRYRFRLRDAAKALADVDLALDAGGALFAPPSTWLVHPSSATAGVYRFHVTTPAGVEFATGIRRAVRGAAGTFEAPIDDFEESSFAGLGALRVRRLLDPGVDLVMGPGLGISEDAITAWAKLELGLVADFFGRPPSDASALFVVPGTAEVMRGKTLGGGGSSVFVRVGTAVTEATLKDDWVLCHELIHLGFPSIDPGHRWFSEGLASYVEPVIRARAGLVTPEKFWLDLVEGLPQGLPRPGDKGMDDNDEWGRVYWGGTLFFLLADLGIRQRTGGARDLRAAVRAAAAAGNVEAFMPLARIVEVGDRATGTTVLHELYERLAREPGTEDLDALWKRLGVVRDGASIRFDGGAPGAWFRDAILERH